MELPPALTPWSEYLNLLPSEFIREIGPMVQRLDMAIGPLRVQSQDGMGDPDGFDGIARRGSYERLLLSEWLFADEVPEEFARRAAMTEHAFLQLARQQQAGARISVALFDTGPNQLGAPRIAHLAALIVLARRAEATGARFEWGLLQRPQDTPQSSVTIDGVRALFDTRSAREATDEDLAILREQFASKVGQDDLWIVGGRRLARLPAAQGASLLTVREPFDTSKRSLEASIRVNGRPAFEVTLALPDEITCIRLLRNPFQAPASREIQRERQRNGPTSNLLFLPGGTKLLARLGRESIAAYPVPNSPSAGAGKPKMLVAPSRNPIVAAGRCMKCYAVVTTTEEPSVLRIEWIGKARFPLRVGTFRLPTSVPGPVITDSSPLSPLFPLYAPAQQNAPAIDSGWLMIVNTTLLHIVFSDESNAVPMAEIECSSVSAVVQSMEGVGWIGKRDGEWMLAAMYKNQARHIYQQFEDVIMAYFGGGGSAEHPAYRLAAARTAGEIWNTYSHDRSSETAAHTAASRISSALHVVGIYGLADQMNRESGLIIMEPDGRSLSYSHKEGSGPLLTASAEFAQITVSPYVHGGSGLTNIAYITKLGELVVYSLAYRANVFRMQFNDSLTSPTVAP